MPSVSIPTAMVGADVAAGASTLAAATAADATASFGTAAVIGSQLPSFSTILGGASLASSALGSIAQGRAGQASANYNAQVAQQNAELATRQATTAGQIGAAQTAAASQKTRAEVGSITAAQAANGIDINKGSAVDVRSSAAELGELNAINIRSNAARSAYGYQVQSTSDTAQAQLDKAQGKYAAEAGDINAGTTLIGGAAQGYQTGLWGTHISSGALNSGSF